MDKKLGFFPVWIPKSFKYKQREIAIFLSDNFRFQTVAHSLDFSRIKRGPPTEHQILWSVIFLKRDFWKSAEKNPRVCSKPSAALWSFWSLFPRWSPSNHHHLNVWLFRVGIKKEKAPEKLYKWSNFVIWSFQVFLGGVSERARILSPCLTHHNIPQHVGAVEGLH